MMFPSCEFIYCVFNGIFRHFYFIFLEKHDRLLTILRKCGLSTLAFATENLHRVLINRIVSKPETLPQLDFPNQPEGSTVIPFAIQFTQRDSFQENQAVVSSISKK